MSETGTFGLFEELLTYFWLTFDLLLGHFWVTFGLLLGYFWLTFDLLGLLKLLGLLEHV